MRESLFCDGFLCEKNEKFYQDVEHTVLKFIITTFRLHGYYYLEVLSLLLR